MNDYPEMASGEEGMNRETRLGKKSVRRDDESDMGKRRKRQIRFERSSGRSMGAGYYTIKISRREP